MYEDVLASKKHITYLKKMYTKYVIWFKHIWTQELILEHLKIIPYFGKEISF